MCVLTMWKLGNQPEIEIDATRYAALKDALKIQIVALEIEEKFDLVIANYEEFERDIFTTTWGHMVSHSPTWGSMSSARLLLNRRIANLLNICRLYVNQVTHSVGRSSTHVGWTLAQAKAVFSEQYDKSLGYRIMEDLRNHVQHCGLPVKRIVYPSSIERGAEDEPLWSFTFSPELDIEALRNDDSFKRKTLHELESLPDSQNDTILFIRQYIEGLGHAQVGLRELIAPAVDKAAAAFHSALTEWKAAGHDARGLIAAKHRHDSIAEEPVFVTEDLKKKRDELVALRSGFANLSRRFVSSVRPRDAYPSFR